MTLGNRMVSSHVVLRSKWYPHDWYFGCRLASHQTQRARPGIMHTRHEAECCSEPRSCLLVAQHTACLQHLLLRRVPRAAITGCCRRFLAVAFRWLRPQLVKDEPSLRRRHFVRAYIQDGTRMAAVTSLPLRWVGRWAQWLQPTPRCGSPPCPALPITWKGGVHVPHLLSCSGSAEDLFSYEIPIWEVVQSFKWVLVQSFPLEGFFFNSYVLLNSREIWNNFLAALLQPICL